MEAEPAALAKKAIVTLPGIEEPGDPLDPIADEASIRLGQELFMLESGVSMKSVRMRLQRYKAYINNALLSERPLA